MQYSYYQTVKRMVISNQLLYLVYANAFAFGLVSVVMDQIVTMQMDR